MKTAEEFQAFYRSTLAPVVDGLEAERARLIRKIYYFVAAALAALVLGNVISAVTDKAPEPVPGSRNLYAVQQEGPSQNSGGSGVLFPILIVGGLGYYFWFRPRSKELKDRFKTEVIGSMVKFVDESLAYNPSSGISRSEYDQSKIFLTSGDRYRSEDLVSGKLGSTAIRFSEVHAERKEESGGNGEENSTTTSWETLFKGILFVADFNKHFKGRTVVLTDQAEKNLGRLGTLFQKMNVSRDPLIKLENPDFEKSFAVYGTDTVEAHYILSPALMERILKFKSRVGNIQLSFVNASVYIAIPIHENLFEARILSSWNHYPQLEKYHGQLQLFTGIVDDLNLNNRIWTKE